MRYLFCIASLLFSSSVFALEIGSEVNFGYAGETQLRIGPVFSLSPHWIVDSGVSVIEYNGAHDCVGAIDTTFLHRTVFKKWFLDVGTGPAGWTRKTWGHEDSKTLWTFSNKVGLGYHISDHSIIGFQWRHYSNGFFSPNTSKDFVGLRFSYTIE